MFVGCKNLKFLNFVIFYVFVYLCVLLCVEKREFVILFYNIYRLLFFYSKYMYIEIVDIVFVIFIILFFWWFSVKFGVEFYKVWEFFNIFKYFV